MAVEDLEYVEKVTGISLDDDKPLENIRRKLPRESEQPRSTKSGTSIEPPKLPEYDWFDFFLKAGVGPQLCERYAQAMNREAMEEKILPEVGQETLRKLGLKEGDILKVMKFLDNKYGRSNKLRNEETNGNVAKTNGSTGGLFTGPDGSLQNNTRRGRPEANRQASDVVDAKVFEPKDEREKGPPPESRPTPLTTAPPREKVQSGFDDDAWEVKPSKQASTTSQPAPTTVASSQPTLSGALVDLSLLSVPLQPTKATPQHVSQQAQPQVSQQPQPTGANPGFFSQLNSQPTGFQPPGVFQQSPQSQPQANGFQQIPQLNSSTQRPQPPQQSFGPGSLLPPPPRPLSAPQNVQQQSQFGLLPLQPQLTGIPQTSPLQAPPGQSLNELDQQRFQQQYGQQSVQQQPTGFVQSGRGQFGNGFQPQQTGFQQQQPQFTNFQPQPQPFVNGNAQGSPFADPRPSYQSSLAPQQTGYAGYSQQGPLPGGINSILPPALQPHPTGFAQQQSQPPSFQQTQQTGYQQPQQTGFQQPQQTGFGQSPQQNGFNNQNFQAPPIPPMPQQPTIAPLQPQKTGPAPPVRFGVEAKKLTPQATGRRANLSQASKFISNDLSWSVLTHMK
jgi:actin cytoskeleton-regulatory complex protein SLA1